MADEAKAEGEATPQEKGKLLDVRQEADRSGVTKGLITIAMVGGVGLSVFSLPSFLILTLGMLPSIVSFMIERGDRQAEARTVAAFNFAGVLPFLFILWKKGGHMNAALDVISNVYVWLAMYGAAAIAVGVLWVVPRVIGAMLEVYGSQRTRQIRKRQMELMEEWGEDLPADAEVENFLKAQHAAVEEEDDDDEDDEDEDDGPKVAYAD